MANEAEPQTKREILTWRSQNQNVVARKSEIRISKFETNPKSEI
jgi:hypothetical protein